MTHELPSRLTIVQYAFIAAPVAFAGLPLYIHMPDFYTRNLGMSIGLIGIILLGIRLFDAIQDPIIGYFSDKNAHIRYQIVLIGVTLLIIGLAAMFYGPDASIPLPIWFALSMLLATTGFSIVTINLNMIGSFWRDEPEQRTRISAWREAFVLLGLLTASILPTLLQYFTTPDYVFRYMFWLFAVFMVSAFLLFSRFMRLISSNPVITNLNSTKGFSFLSILLGTDRHFFAIYFLAHLAAAMPAVLVIFFIRDYLQADVFSGLFLSLYFIAGAGLMVIWVKLSNQLGKQKTWLASMLLSVFVFMWAYFLQPGDFIAFGIICALSGMALGADLALPPAILADRISNQNTQAEATQYYALITFIPKIAFAVASGISFIILGQFNYSAGNENSSDALKVLIILYALIPCVIKLSAALYLWWLNKYEGEFYAIDKRNNSNGTYDVT